MSTPKILLTGATGFMGGTILTTLLSSSSTSSSQEIPLPITCLVRTPEAAAKLTATYGPSLLHPILFASLDDTSSLTTAASSHDIVIHTSLSYHTPSALALLAGLAQRKRVTGQKVWMIHTSGTSNVADFPVSRKRYVSSDDFVLDDEEDDVYSFERDREKEWGYGQRATEIAVVEGGLELGVETVVVMCPTIFGVGTGLFNRVSIQVPAYIRAGIEHGRVVVVGEGKGVWNYVHVQDMADLYLLVVGRIVKRDGEGLPMGKKGILFCENGMFSWMDAARGAAQVLFEEGLVEENKVECVDRAEGARVLGSLMGFVDEDIIEVALSSNARTRASVGRRLGWVPTRGEEEWKKGFKDDLKEILRTRGGR
ncbi:hypothetical protein QBC47DRAFT_343028 [Echria macrotheca]|uniref:NAD-dependent epimerase/dehydratase domain-containing protein n=1 Tax=Echria macrotheca TaxID=438768 RepID=A0AAJ0BEC8_9PEZI|nr:hypothetical protein QBC47DRAFT_343028 [Echria macrotheca]